MNKPYFTYNAGEDFQIKAFDTYPHVKGYQAHKDKVQLDKFPDCCEFHSSAYEFIKNWYDKDFPIFTKEEKKLYTWFIKSDYEYLPEKIITQISYTEYFIHSKISSENWFRDIKNYIDYNILSFGMPAFGCPLFLLMIKKYLSDVDEELDVVKKEKIAAYIDRKLYPDVNKNKVDAEASPDVIYATIQKWLKIFPFQIKGLDDFKKQFERKWLIIKRVKDYNPYTKSYMIQTITNSELTDYLISMTRELLKRVNSSELINNGSITKFNTNKLDVLTGSHTLKQQKLLNDYSTEELTYIEILEKWFNNEKEFINGLSTLINDKSLHVAFDNTSIDLYTFKTSLTEKSLEILRIKLIKQGYISEIDNEDFLYLFSNKPAIPSLTPIHWLKPVSYCHYLLKSIVYDDGDFNNLQGNACILFKNGKKLNSNSNKGGYLEIDQLLKSIES